VKIKKMKSFKKIKKMAVAIEKKFFKNYQP